MEEKRTAPNRRIVCITGTRADYPRVKAVLKEIDSRSNLDLKLIVTGSHLLEEYGHSVREIVEDGYNIAENVHMYVGDFDTPLGMTKAAARCVDGIADALAYLGPDIVLITVDRVETLAAAVTAALMNFPIAHIQGGEVTGTIDESIRHAVTKLSHIHFPATEDAAERIIKMGEPEQLVFKTGCPYIDIINNTKYLRKSDLVKKYNFDANRPLVLLIQHPVTTEYGSSEDQYLTTVNALEAFPELEIIAIYSNADAGGRAIIKEIKKRHHFYVFSNLPSYDFLSLMKAADLMIGNSSAAIREAPSFKLAAINIGSRQNGRLRASNVIDVRHDQVDIQRAIRKALYDDDFKAELESTFNPYGDGKASKRIVDILENINLSANLIQKRICY
jgi:UDP-N-acetylglucosamine 2-epimerase (non-hydrolysing)/GDP/UDP-N,N'-diacetylbacillosamine 2-epimerase (hydrolysing)